MKSKVFLSRSFNDQSRKLDMLINTLGVYPKIDLWLAKNNLKVGNKISDVINKAISDSDYFINIISFKESYWKNTELLLASANEQANQNLKVIHVALDRFNSNERIIASGEQIVFDFSIEFEKSMNDLIRFISINKSDSIIDFKLDILTETKPIIEITKTINEKLIEFYIKNPEQLKIIDRRLFEEFIADIFYKFKYTVELTQQTRDGGRDIIAVKYAETKVKYLIECKRPDIGNSVGVRAVRELFGVMQDEKATKAILATTSYFSKDANLFFNRNKWEMEARDFDGIMEWIELYKSENNIS